MSAALTPEQRAEIMRKAGIPDDVIVAHEPRGITPVIHEEPEHATVAPVAELLTEALAHVAHDVPREPEPVVKQTASTGTLDDDAQALIERASGDKDMALALVDDHVQAWFDERKLSKIEAAKRGLDRSEHNKPLWAAAQDMRSKLKARVRQHYAGAGGFVQRKAAAHVSTSLVDEFMASTGVDNPAIAEFLTQFAKHVNAQKG